MRSYIQATFAKILNNINPIKIKNNIPWSPNTKYLGVHLYSNLNFNTHTANTVQKPRDIRVGLYPHLNNRAKIPEKCEFSIYKMSSNLKHELDQTIEAIQNIALRTITGIPWYVPPKTHFTFYLHSYKIYIYIYVYDLYISSVGQ